MKYRKKPIMIEAFKWTGGPDQIEDPSWACEAIKSGKIWFSNPETKDVCMEIETLEGVMCARQGDFIIQGVKGEIYPCKPDIFAATYESAEKPAPDDEGRKMRKVVDAAIEYKQAIKDHAGDACQCGNSPQLCLGDCGPANARKLLKALAALDGGAGKGEGR